MYRETPRVSDVKSWLGSLDFANRQSPPPLLISLALGMFAFLPLFFLSLFFSVSLALNVFIVRQVVPSREHFRGISRARREHCVSRHIAKAKERRKEKDFRVFLAEKMIYGVRVKINETHS